MIENALNPQTLPSQAPNPRWGHQETKAHREVRTVRLDEQNLKAARPSLSCILSVPVNLKVSKALGKTLKFRAITLVTTLGITWLLTGNPVTSLGVTALQQSTNTAVYYFFEQSEKAKALGAGN